MAVDACAPFIETLLSMMLSLPSPRHRLVYYANLLLDVSRMITPAPQARTPSQSLLSPRLLTSHPNTRTAGLHLRRPRELISHSRLPSTPAFEPLLQLLLIITLGTAACSASPIGPRRLCKEGTLHS